MPSAKVEAPATTPPEEASPFDAAEPELRDRGGAVVQETRPVRPISPGAGNDLGPVERTEVVLEVLHHRVEQLGVCSFQGETSA